MSNNIKLSMWQVAYDYFRDSKVIKDCLSVLDNCNKDNRWRNYDVDSFLSIINATGIGLSFFYGYSWLEAQIVDENKDKFLDKRSVKWRNLKEKGLIRLCIFVNNTATKPKYPAQCMNRLLEILKKEFGYYITQVSDLKFCQ